MKSSIQAILENLNKMYPYANIRYERPQPFWLFDAPSWNEEPKTTIRIYTVDELKIQLSAMHIKELVKI